MYIYIYIYMYINILINLYIYISIYLSTDIGRTSMVGVGQSPMVGRRLVISCGGSVDHRKWGSVDRRGRGPGLSSIVRGRSVV